MTIRTPSWLQAGSYPAENDRLLIQSLLSGSPNQTPSTGVVGRTDLIVTASGTPDMNVHVASGAAFVSGSETTTQGVYGFYSDASVTVPIAASTSQPRISLIVAQVLDAGYSGASNVGQIVEVAGVPASSPVAPAVPKNSIVLAQISVAASVASITSSAITDKRSFYGTVPGFRYFRSAGWATATGDSAFGFDAVSYDTSGMYNAGSGVFTVPKTGRWKLDGLLYVTSSAASQSFKLSWFKSGAIFIPGSTAYAVASGQFIFSVLNDEQVLNAGDQLTSTVTPSVAGLTGGTSLSARISAHFVSP